MINKLNLLILESNDSNYDALLSELKKLPAQNTATRIESHDAFTQALRSNLPHLIITECSTSHFTATQVIVEAARFNPTLPVIVTMAIPDVDAAVEYIKAGASDVILTTHFDRIGRAISDALTRRSKNEDKERFNKELQEREERHRLALESVSEIVYRAKVVDHGSLPDSMEYVSETVEKILGYTCNDIVQDPELWLQIIHPEDVPLVLEFRKECVVEGKHMRGSYRVRHKTTGEYRWIEDSIVPVHNQEGVVAGIRGNARDITDRKMVEETLRKLSRALEQTADNVVIADRDGVIEYVNPAFEKKTGYSKEEAIGKTPRILKSGNHSKKFYKNLWEAILSGNVFHAEFLNKKKNGELYYQEETITPVFDANGSVVHFISTGRDVTERKIAEQSLRESEERFSKIVHASPAGICVTNSADGTFVDVNEKFLEIFGYAREDIVGLTYEDVHVLAFPEQGYALRDELKTQGHIKDREIRFRRKNGMIGTAIASIELVEINGAECALSFFHDVTQRRALEQSIGVANSQLKTIADNLEEVFFSMDVVNQKLLLISSTCEKVYGYPPEAFEKNPQLWLEVVHPDDLRIVEASAPSATSDGRLMHSEYRIIRPDGTLRWVEAKIKPFVDETKRLVRIDGVVSDITERMRAENDF